MRPLCRNATNIALSALGLVGIVLTWTGCDQLFDIQEGEPVATDAGVDGGGRDATLGEAATDAPPRDATADTTSDAGVDADPTIHGTWIHHHVTDNGLADDYVDFTTTPIAACVPNAAADGGADCYAGSGTALGTFTITGVPPNDTYYVHTGSTWFYTKDRTIDLSDYTLGRIDTAEMDAGSDPSLSTVIALNVTGAAAWGPGDMLELESTNAGVTVQGLEKLGGATNLPDGGDTTLSIRGPWIHTLPIGNGGTSGLVKLVDATRQDQTILLQLAPQDAGAPGSTYQGLTRILTSTSFSTVPYTTSTLSGAFQPPTGSATANLTWHHDDFRQHATDLHPRATSVFEQLFFDVVRGDGSYGVFSATPDLLVYTLPNGNTGNESLALQVPNPFPASVSKNGGWTPYVSPSVAYTVNEQLPLGDGGTEPFPLIGSFGCSTDLKTLQSAPDIVPSVAPVSGPQIGARDFFQDQTNVGTTPIISWQPGTFGLPAVYYTLYVVEVTHGPAYTVVATLATSGTSVTLAPGIMQPGHHYVMQISSFWTSVAGAVDTPFQLPLPNCATLNASGVFTP